MSLKSEELYQINFPDENLENVSLNPIFEITTKYKIDTSSVFLTSPSYDYYDSTISDYIKTPVNIMLMSDDFFDEHTDTLQSYLAVPLEINVKNDTTLLIFTKSTLFHDEVYTIKVYDDLKLLKPDSLGPEVFDTININELVFDSYFKTIPFPLKISKTSIRENGKVFCDEEIKFYLNRPFWFDSTQLNSMFTFNELSFNDSLSSYEYNTKDFEVAMSNDSTEIIITPTSSLEPKSDYNIGVDFSSYQGDNSYNGTYEFFVPNSVHVKSTILQHGPPDSTFDAEPSIGKGEFAVSYGDSVAFHFPRFSGEKVLLQLKEIKDGEITFLSNPNVMIKPECGNAKDVEYVAIYDKSPIDILELNNLPGTFTCNITEVMDSVVVVQNYIEKINDSTYSYERYSQNPIYISLIDCPEFPFSHWESEDFDDPDSLLKEPGINLPRKEELESAFIGGTGNIGIGVVTQNNNTCSTATFKLRVYYDVDGMGDPTSGINMNNILKNVKLDGMNIVLTPDPSNSWIMTYEASFTPRKSITFSGEMNDISCEIEYASGHRIWSGARGTEFNKRLGNTFSETLTIPVQHPTCEATLNINIRKKRVKLETFITTFDDKHTPSHNISTIKFNPFPPRQIQDLNGNPHWTTIKYENSITPYYSIYQYLTEKRTIIEDPENEDLKICILRELPVYYYYGTDVEITPIVKANNGFSMKEWSDDTGFDDFTYVSEENNIIEIEMNANKKVKKLLSDGFRLTDIYVANPDLNATDYWFYYKANPHDATNELKPWLFNDNKPDFGVRLDYDFETNYYGSFENRPQHLKELLYHKKTMQIGLKFNKKVNVNSVIENVVLKDNNKNNTRIDGRNNRIYDLVFNENLSLSHDQTSVLLTCKTTIGDEDWMCHDNKFSIDFDNNLADNVMNRIRSSEVGEDPEPLVYPSNNAEGIKTQFIGRTVLPGIKITSISFQNCTVYDWKWWLWFYNDKLDIKIHCIPIFADTDFYNGAEHSPSGNYELDENGRYVYKVDNIEFPTTGSKKEFERGSTYKIEKPLLILSQLKENSFIILPFHWIKDKEGALINKLADITSGVQADLPAIIKDEKDIDEKNKLIIKLLGEVVASVMQQLKKKDESIGWTNLYLKKEASPYNKIIPNIILEPIPDSEYEVITGDFSTINNQSKYWGMKGRVYKRNQIHFTDEESNLDYNLDARYINGKVNTKLLLEMGDF